MSQSPENQAYWPLAAGAIFFLLVVLLTATRQLPYRETLEAPAPRTAEDSSALVIPEFSDRTLQSGLFAYHLQGGESLTGLDETLGAGACALDYDNDNDIDLFVVGGSGQSRYYGKREWWQQAQGNVLYRNTGNGEFENVTVTAGLDQPMWGMGCIAGDLDNDGDADLLMTNKGSNILYRNNGDGSFTDVSTASGIDGDEWSTSAVIADYDADGLLDIYFVNYIEFSKLHLTYEGSTGFKSTLPVRFDASLYNSQPNKLYKNTGSLIFTDTTQLAGVADASGRGIAAGWTDLDADGYPDLVLSNDAGFPNSVFINQRNGRFAQRSEPLHLNTTQATRGLGAGDVDNDGDLDLFFATPQGSLPLLYIKGDTPWPVKSKSILTGKRFTDLARETELTQDQHATLSGWGVGLRDFNNDGWLDVMSTNGLLTTDPDNPAIPLGQPKQLWLNKGNGQFTDAGSATGPGFHDAISGRSTVFADFDNDGDIDIYATHNHYLGQLLVNNTPPHNWLGLQLVTSSGNRDAIGARVWLQTTTGTQYRELSDASGFLSGSDKRIHFGLGTETRAVRVTIEWPDHSQSIFNNIPANRYLQITQGSDEVAPISFASHGERTPPLDFLFNHDGTASHFLNWRAEPDAFALIKPTLTQALASTDPAIRQHAVDLLQDLKSPQALALLVTALADDNETIRLAALTVLGEYEEGYIVHALLRLFDDPSDQIRCTLADLFAFYFREEEAVTHYKYLAVPHLIRMLDNPNAELRSCAAHALADAEQYRAVDALLQRLDDEDIEVRAAAVRALGQIREQSAEPVLRALLDDPTQPPLVLAHTLIALKRLGAENIDTTLTRLLPGKLSADNSEQASRVLQAVVLLMGDLPDGVVFKPDDLSAHVLQWLIANRTYLDADTSGHSDRLLATSLQILRRVRGDTPTRLARHYTAHRNGTVRAHAFMVLLASSQESVSSIDAALSDKDIITQSMVIEFMMTTDIHPSYEQLKPLLAHPATRETATRLLSRLTSPESGREIMRILSSDSSSDMQKLTILESLNDHHETAINLPESLMLETRRDIRIATLNAWERLNRNTRVPAIPVIVERGLRDTLPAVQQRAYTILARRHDSWAKKAIEQLLFNSVARKDLRLPVLEALASTESIAAESIIQRLSTRRHDPLSDDAVAYLGHFDSPTSMKIIMSSINNKEDAFRRRMAASSALYLHQPAQAMNALFSMTEITPDTKR